jgi:hypothetical protein
MRVEDRQLAEAGRPGERRSAPSTALATARASVEARAGDARAEIRAPRACRRRSRTAGRRPFLAGRCGVAAPLHTPTLRGRTCARRPETVRAQDRAAPRRSADVPAVALIAPRRMRVFVARI